MKTIAQPPDVEAPDSPDEMGGLNARAEAAAANIQLLAGGTAIYDPVPGHEAEMERAIDILRNRQDMARILQTRRLMVTRVHSGRRRTPRTMRATRVSRHTTCRRVSAFSAGGKQAAALSDDGGGGDPPSSAWLAPWAEPASPDTRLEPPAYPSSARRGDPVPACGAYESATRTHPSDHQAWPWYYAAGDCVDYEDALRYARHYSAVVDQIGGYTLEMHSRRPLTDALHFGLVDEAGSQVTA